MTYETDQTNPSVASASDIDLSAIVVPTPEKVVKEEKGETTATPFPLLPLPLSPVPVVASPTPPVVLPDDDDIFTPAPLGNPVLGALQGAGLYLRELSPGQHAVTCPWAHEHADGDHGPANYFSPTPLRPVGGFACPHKHADQPRIDNLLDQLGLDASAARCKPRIRLAAGEMVRIADRAEQVLASFGDYYQSGGSIVTVNITTLGDAATVVVGEQTLSKALALTIDWERYDAKSKEWRRCDPTPQVIRHLLHAQTYDHLPVLDRIARQPYFFGPDEALITESGYHPASKVYAAFGHETFPMHDVSEAAARDALSKLEALLAEFHFASEIDRATALSAILTAAVRSSLSLAPAVNITASTPGSGKSYLAELLAAFGGPGEALKLSYPTSSDEATKAMLAALIGKPAVICFDDMQTDWLPYGMMNRMLTSETVADRVLGSNNTKQVGTNTFFMGTGNNVSPVRDMCRRVVSIALAPQTGSPATLDYHHDPVAKVKGDRGRYVSLGLTIVRAWQQAGRPKASVPNIATFGDWSNLCRQPLIWLGHADPATSLIEQVQHDPDAESLGRMMIVWRSLFSGNAVTLRKVVDRAETNTDLHDAIFDLPVVERGIIHNHKFGWYLKKSANRIVNGLFIRREHSSERTAWSVQSVDPTDRSVATPEETVPDGAQAWIEDVGVAHGAAPGEIF